MNSSNQDSTNQRQLHLLHADDNIINQYILKNILNTLGHSTDVVETGSLAVEKFLQNQYDAILMDLVMPEMDGIEATKIIRKVEREIGVSKPIRIIALTGYSNQQNVDRLYSLGFDDIVMKPATPKKLYDILSKISF